MITIVTEKPSVAQTIAKELGVYNRADGYIYNDRYSVTWAMGHLVEMYVPEDYGEWSAERLPIIPQGFKLRVRQKNGKEDRDAASQLAVIRKLLDQSEYIINAGDAGREGELIQRNIYEYLGYRGKVMRLWISSLTSESIRKGFSNLLPSSEFDALYLSAKIRAEADWIVGCNATRAMTISADVGKTLSLGRVQTPTLAIVCKRYIQNKDFKPEPFWVIKATCRMNNYCFDLSSEKYFDKAAAQRDMDAIRAQGYIEVTKCESHQAVSHPPLLHDITSLQQEANKQYKYSASKTLEIAQTLYENKYLTYPRTGSRYVPEDVFAQIPALIRSLEQDKDYGQIAASYAGKTLNRHSVNDTKITDHHAILITEDIPTQLTDEQWDIYLLVAERILEAFGEDSISDVRNVEAVCAGIPLKAHGSIVRVPGWKSVRGVEPPEEDSQTLPDMAVGTYLNPEKYTLADGMTKPQPLLTEETLLGKMKNPAEDISDEQVRKRLAEVGLGTPATRAATIDTLFDRGYIEKEKGKLVPTTLGLSVYCAVSEQDIADPVWTGKWENALEYIAEGKNLAEKFWTGICEYVKKIVAEFLEGEHRKDIRYALASETVKCPACGKTVRIVEEKAYCKECGLTIWRKIAGKKLTDAQIRLLLEGGETGVIKGFTSKTGNKFDAALKRDNEGKIKFIFKND